MFQPRTPAGPGDDHKMRKESARKHCPESLHGNLGLYSKEMLPRVMTSFPSRIHERAERHGGYLQSAIFKP